MKLSLNILTLTVAATSLLALPALAETTEIKGYKTITTLVGFEKSTIGNIIIEGGGNVDENGNRLRTPDDVSREEAFSILDKNKDNQLTEKEMFSQSDRMPPKRGRTNLVTRSGNPIGIDYYLEKQTHPIRVRVEDKTEDGSFFSTMDVNDDNVISMKEFSFDLIKPQNVPEQTIEPAAGPAIE